MDDLIAEAHIVAIFDSLDECDVPAVQKHFPLLDNTKYCKKVTVIVSSRPEAVSGMEGRALTQGPCFVQYVQPFTEDDMRTYVDKAYVEKIVKEYTGLTVPTVPTAIDRLKELGLEGSLLTTPVTLRMGVEILLHELDAQLPPFDPKDPHRRTPDQIMEDCRSATTNLVMDYPKGTPAALYQKYILSRLSNRGKRASDKESLLLTQGGAVVMEYFCSLWKVALRMLSTGHWSVPLSGVLEDFGVNGRELLKTYVPMRVESLDDLKADFSFFHKTIGEFLCAQAFWCGHTQEYLESVTYPFSKRELGVLEFFHECAMSDFQRRMYICGGCIVHGLHTWRQMADRSACISNAMALLGISQYPLQGTDLSGLSVRDANLYEMQFESTSLPETEFITVTC